MTISICGSSTFLKEMVELQKKLESFGFEVHTPLENGIDNLNQEVVVTSKMQGEATRASFKLIQESEGILVANYSKNGVEGYIGGNTLIEIGYAFAGNKDIFLLNPIPDVPYRAEIEATQPMVLNGDLTKIQEYFQSLPVVYVSSENVLKMKAVSLGFRKLGVGVRVIGMKTNSGVAEMPSSIEETHQGVYNRLGHMKELIAEHDYDWLVSLEDGMAKLHSKHNVFGVIICVIENAEGEQHITMNSSFEHPKEMTDLVPSEYPDLGILVQEKYGQKFKDPFIVFTRGKVSRLELMKNGVANTLALFE